jgi:hypothetical protein
LGHLLLRFFEEESLNQRIVCFVISRSEASLIGHLCLGQLVEKTLSFLPTPRFIFLFTAFGSIGFVLFCRLIQLSEAL